MHKKSESGNWILWIIRVFLTFLVISFIVFYLNNSIKSNLDIREIRFYTFAERILYSPDCFVFQENGRAYPGIFDYKKLSEENLNKCFAKFPDEESLVTKSKTGIKQDIGSKITIFYNGKENEFFYNREYYEDAKALAFSNYYELESKRYFILINENNELIPGNILIEAVWRK